MKIKAMKWAFGLAWRFNRKMLILCCLILSAVSVLPALALMYRRTILGALNLFLQTGEGSMGDILPAILLFGIITALVGLSNRLNDELIYSVMFDSYYFGMEEVLMDSVQGYTMEELLRKDANDEYHACVMREGSLTDFISGFCSLLGKFVGIFSLLAVAFFASKPVFVITVVYIAGVIWMNLAFMEKLRRRQYKIRDKERLAGYYEGMPYLADCAKELRIFESQEFILKNWREAYGAVFDHEMKNSLTVELRTFVSGFGLYLFLAVMIVYSLFAVAQGSMTADVLLVIFTLCMNVFTAVSGVARTLMSTDYGLYALERQYRIFGRRAEQEAGLKQGDAPAEAVLGEDPKAVSFGFSAENSEPETVFGTEGISFSYKGDKLALDNVSIQVSRGETVALVGPNGSGKSTLVKVLLQLYRPMGGKLYYFGKDYESLKEGFLKCRIGAFFQDYYLFHMPIWENIGFGDIGHVDDRERIEAALEKGQAKSFVRKLPLGTETFVHKNVVKEGMEFSGGERQKLAVSRAYMSDKDIFVFDEPASMLDPISELEQFMNIRDTVKGRTAILISHRVGFARLADRIILLDGGKAAESGSHQELMAKGGLYARMFCEQAQWYRQEPEKGGAGCE